MLLILGGIILLIGFGMGHYKNVPYFLLVITKVMFYPIGIIGNIVPDVFPKRMNDLMIICIADLIVSFFFTLIVIGLKLVIKRS
jgi:hypothetical protein